LLLAGSLSLTSYALSASQGMVSTLPSTVKALLTTLQFVLMSVGMAALYRYVPNTRVRWSHALVGGFFVAVGLELAKKLLTWYLSSVPTYSLVYGTFASVPILLVWIYLAWVIVLLGAVVTAYLPSLLSGIARRADTPGWGFMLALEMLQILRRARSGDARGLSLEAIAQALRVDPLNLEGPAGHMVALDWLARLNEDGERYVLLLDLDRMPLADLAERLLLGREPSTQVFWTASGWQHMTVADALGAA
jgi:membrane protein